MSNGKTVSNDGAVMHIDLRLVPLSKQVNLIWLSRVVKSPSELREKTGLNELYIKYILENKSIILKNWRESLQQTRKVNTNEKDDHDAIDILLLEWIRCCTLNKIVLYRYAIEMQANDLKDFFELPKYRIKEELWQDINLIKEYNMEYVTSTTTEKQIPYDLYTIFKTNGAKLLKLQTYVRFSLLLKRKINTDCINLLKKTYCEPRSSDDNNSSEQFDDLILIEKPIECIDVTVEEDNLKREQLSPQSNTESSNHTITTFNTDETSYDFPTSIDPKISIKEEPCELMDTEIIKEYQQIQIKNEFIQDDDMTNKSNENIESNINKNAPTEEENDVKFDVDIGEEFLQVADPKSIGVLNADSEEIQTIIKMELENENENDNHEIMKKSQITGNIKTHAMQQFKILEFENTAKAIENTETDNGNKRVLRQQKVREYNSRNKVTATNEKVNNNSKISNNVTTNIQPEPIFKDSNDSRKFLTNNIKTEPDMVKNNVTCSEKIVNKNNTKNALTEKEIPEFNNNRDNTEDDDDDNIDAASSQIEVIYEIDDSDEDMQSELQQIINNYRKKDTNKQQDKDKENEEEEQQEIHNEYNEDNDDKTITVLEIMSENEDNANDDDNDNIQSNHKDVAVLLNNKKRSEKRKRLEILSDSEETFNPNLPSTSRLAAAANIASTKLPSSSTSSKASIRKTPRLNSTSEDEGEKEPNAQNKIQNNTDAIKYLQHIKNYLLSQNDEVGVKLLLNLQLAFINFD